MADADGGTLSVFGGKRSLGLMRPAISPNGRYVSFLALGEALPYPPAWQQDPAFQQWPERGFVVPQTELVLAELPATIPTTSRPGPSKSAAVLRLALDAGCISDYVWGLAALWSDNSEHYLVCGPSPVGDGSAANEPLVGPFRPQHLFAVDVRTGAAQRVMDETPQQMLVFDEQARRVVVMLRNGDLVTLRRSDKTAGKWKEEQRTKLPASDLRYLSAAPGDTRRFVGIHQTTTVPPDLWLLDAKTGHKTALTEINPELQGQTLGRLENIQWVGSNAARNRGYLIYPVGYKAGTRYPCVILCKSWDDTFIHGGNGGYSSNFAPQALVNCGFVVLLMQDSIGPYPKGTWERLPGGVSEAFRAMDAYETARRELDRRGLIEPGRVGLMGFSRTSWTVDFTITHSKETWAAAVSADSGIYNYGTYLGDRNLRSGMAAMYGGPPWGKTSKRGWITLRPFRPGTCARRCSCNITEKFPWPRSFTRRCPPRRSRWSWFFFRTGSISWNFRYSGSARCRVRWTGSASGCRATRTRIRNTWGNTHGGASSAHNMSGTRDSSQQVETLPRSSSSTARAEESKNPNRRKEESQSPIGTRTPGWCQRKKFEV